MVPSNLHFEVLLSLKWNFELEMLSVTQKTEDSYLVVCFIKKENFIFKGLGESL